MRLTMLLDEEDSYGALYRIAESVTRFAVLIASHFGTATFFGFVIGAGLGPVLMRFRGPGYPDWVSVGAGAAGALLGGILVFSILPNASREGRFAFLMPTGLFAWYMARAWLSGAKSFDQFAHDQGTSVMLIIVASSVAYSFVQFVARHVRVRTPQSEQ